MADNEKIVVTLPNANCNIIRTISYSLAVVTAPDHVRNKISNIRIFIRAGQS